MELMMSQQTRTRTDLRERMKASRATDRELWHLKRVAQEGMIRHDDDDDGATDRRLAPGRVRELEGDPAAVEYVRMLWED